MADIFISYAREDRDWIMGLADSLTDAGYTVWWDKQVTAGSEFSKETAAELDAAKIVLVAWSKASIGSYWVADEAAEGRESGRLLPISIDQSAPPLGFRQFQTIDFEPWSKGDAAPFADLSHAIAQRLEAPVRPIAAPPRPDADNGKGISRRALALGVAGLVGAGIGGSLLFDIPLPGIFGGPRRMRKDRYESIAVLPFADRSEKQDQGWFIDGIIEEILNALSRNKQLKVAARTSSFLFRDSKEDPARIAGALGVETLLEGSVRIAGGQLRISGQLIDAENGFQLWSASFDRVARDLFKVQDEIASVILRELDSTLRAPPNAKRPRSLEAFQLFVSAKFHAEQRSPASLRRAREEFGKVIAMEPDFAPAHALLADTSWRSSIYDHGDLPPEEATGLAKASLARAYALDRNLIEARAVDASLRTIDALNGVTGREDLVLAEKIARGVVAEDPGFMLGYSELTFNLLVQGKLADAIEFGEQMTAIDPLGAVSNARLSAALRIAGRVGEAAKVAARAFAYDKQSNLLATAIHYARAQTGDVSGAIAVLLPLLEASPDDLSLRQMMAFSLAYVGFKTEALALAPLDHVRDVVHILLGKVENPAPAIGGELVESDRFVALKLFVARKFSDAIIPLAKVGSSADNSVASMIARLAYAYKVTGATQAAAASTQELLRLLRQMKNQGAGDNMYFDAQVMAHALLGEADDLFGSSELDLYIRSAIEPRPPIEFDPIFDGFKGDQRLADAIVEETRHKWQQRSKLLAQGTMDRLRAVIAKSTK